MVKNFKKSERNERKNARPSEKTTPFSKRVSMLYYYQ